MAVTGSTASGSTTSPTVKIGPSRLNGSAAEVGPRTASCPVTSSSLLSVFARIGSKLGLALRATRCARRRAVSSSTFWRSRYSARVSPKRSGRMRPAIRCTQPASAGALGVTASAAGRCGSGSGSKINRSPSRGCVAGLAAGEWFLNSSWSARRCRSLGELLAEVNVRGTRLLFRFTSTVKDGLTRWRTLYSRLLVSERSATGVRVARM
jgi:hypothetical protein